MPFTSAAGGEAQSGTNKTRSLHVNFFLLLVLVLSLSWQSKASARTKLSHEMSFSCWTLHSYSPPRLIADVASYLAANELSPATLAMREAFRAIGQSNMPRTHARTHARTDAWAHTRTHAQIDAHTACSSV